MSKNVYLDRHYNNLELLKGEKDPKRIERICLDDISIAKHCMKELQADAAQVIGFQMESDKRQKIKREKGYYQAKIKEYVDVVNYITFVELIELYEKQGRTKEAIKICEKAISVGFTKHGSQEGIHERLAKLKGKK